MRNVCGIKFGVMSFFVLTTTMANGFAQHEEAHLEGEHESYLRHHVGLFLGATTRFEADETDFSFGLDYEFRLFPRLGIGLLGEVTFAENEVFIVGAPILLHPTDRLLLGLAPGLEVTDKLLETGHAQPVTETETNFLLRFIASYELEFQTFTLAPGVSLDLVDGEASLVYGISFGKGL